MTARAPETEPATLVVRRLVRAPRARVFDAWTQIRRLTDWWGPQGVACIDAHIDLRVGGFYRIGNRLPDGAVLWIAGVYREVRRPSRLAFSWRVEGAPDHGEEVAVDFLDRDHGRATEVVVTHTRIPDTATRDRHEAGWQGCLEGLTAYLEQ